MKRRITPGMRNLVVWAVAALVCAAIWFFAARPRLHFLDPSAFLLIVAAAAAVLTALLWWETASGADDHDMTSQPPPTGPPAHGGTTEPNRTETRP
jgi:hypothetical protein